MKKVAIFTNFKDYLRSFSPLILSAQQVKALVRHGYKPVLIATEGFAPPAGSSFNMAEIRYIPDVPRDSDDSIKDPKFQADVDMLVGEIEECLKDIDVVITHDLLYLPDYTKYNIACRTVAEKNKKLRWLHWMHSATPPDKLIGERTKFGDIYSDVMGKKFPNSLIVYPNTYDIPRVAKSIGFSEDEVRHVPHWLDFESFNQFHPMTQKLIDKYQILEAEVVCVYPLRLDRGKQPHITMEIMAAIKRSGTTVRMIFMDFQSTGGDKVDYREEIKQSGIELGLNDYDLIFTSEFDSSLQTDCPRQMVSDLFGLSNVFILPSRSETYSLIAQEAMSKGNLIILNHDFPAMRSIYGDVPLYDKFSSDVDILALVAESTGKTDTNYKPSATQHYHDLGQRILYEIRNNRILQGKTWVRTERNMDKVFKVYIDPLINYEGD